MLRMWASYPFPEPHFPHLTELLWILNQKMNEKHITQCLTHCDVINSWGLVHTHMATAFSRASLAFRIQVSPPLRGLSRVSCLCVPKAPWMDLCPGTFHAMSELLVSYTKMWALSREESVCCTLHIIPSIVLGKASVCWWMNKQLLSFTHQK